MEEASASAKASVTQAGSSVLTMYQSLVWNQASTTLVQQVLKGNNSPLPPVCRCSAEVLELSRFAGTMTETTLGFLLPVSLVMQELQPLYYTILYYTILYYTILYYTILYYTILYYTILYYTILYYTILYYTILYYTILYFTLLYYTIPYDIYYTI